MRHVPTIIATVVLIASLVWLFRYAPCGVFYWNNTKDVPERCHAELGARLERIPLRGINSLRSSPRSGDPGATTADPGFPLTRE